MGKAAILSALLPSFGCSQPAKKKTEDLAQPVGKIDAPQNWKPSQRTPKVVVRDMTPDRLLRLEEAIYKMTGASADRFLIKDRGRLKHGSFADITVFDWQTVKDNNTAEITDNAPTGIEAVFINGRQVLAGGKLETEISPGMVL